MINTTQDFKDGEIQKAATGWKFGQGERDK
jgi:hypothetical protein